MSRTRPLQPRPGVRRTPVSRRDLEKLRATANTSNAAIANAAASTAGARGAGRGGARLRYACPVTRIPDGDS